MPPPMPGRRTTGTEKDKQIATSGLAALNTGFYGSKFNIGIDSRAPWRAAIAVLDLNVSDSGRLLFQAGLTGICSLYCVISNRGTPAVLNP